jgi:predicted nucleic acid-binding Zn ribbon protein
MAGGIAQGRAVVGGGGLWRPGLAQFQQRSVWAAIGAWHPWHSRGSWRLRVLRISGFGGGGLRVSSPRAFGIVGRADSTGSMRIPLSGERGKTGSEASDWCAFALVTLADRAIGSAPSAPAPRPLRHRAAESGESAMVPVYVYRREDGSTFELQQRMTEDSLVSCPTTGQRVERVLQPFAPRFKGTGFYSTDHRKAKPTEQPKGAGGE